MIRLIVLILCLIIFFLFSLPLQGVIWLIGKCKPESRLKDTMPRAIVKWAFGVALRIAGTTVEVYGEENIPEDETVLYVANHRGMADIPVIYNQMKTPVGFVAKKEIDKVPFLRLWMRQIGCLFLDRKDPRQGMKTIMAATEKLKSGHSMVICPEGTRSRTDELLEFKEGSFRLAQKSGRRIVPVAIKGTENVLENNPHHFLKKCTVGVMFGEAFAIQDLPEEQKKHVGAYTRELVQQMYDQM
ncbi:MAG: lysophospholipid acyltransferase family protein [Lachnospiraceae bacterium]